MCLLTPKIGVTAIKETPFKRTFWFISIIRIIAYQDDKSMTENTRKVHAVVMCSGYTVTTDGDDARKGVVAMECSFYD